MIRLIKNFFKGTKKHSKFWRDRKIDWKKSYLQTYNHPHRDMISAILTRFQWISLLEVGCGPGANILNIVQHFKGKQVGGIDVNEDAIKLAQETFNGSFLKVGSVNDIMMSDSSTDVVLSDMTLIYISDIDKAMKEIKRVARTHIVLCELHSERLYDRIKLRLTSGYYARNYKKLLDKHGFYNIEFFKIPPEVWDGKPQKPYGYIITAQVPKR